MYENLKADEYGIAVLIYELAKRGHYYSFSALQSGWTFSQFTTTYQLRKALKKLVADGLVIERFKGHNRYGYMTYGASLEARESIEKLKQLAGVPD